MYKTATGYQTGVKIQKIEQKEEELNYISRLKERKDSRGSTLIELDEKTNEEIKSIFEKNKNRENYEKEFRLDENEISLSNNIIDINDLIVQYPELIGGINYLLKSKIQNGELMIGYNKEKKEGGRKQAIGNLTFKKDHNFIQPHHIKGDLERDNNQAIRYLTINIKENEKDNYGRKNYNLIPKIFEIPAKCTLIMQGAIFSKELSGEEFKNALSMLEKNYLTNA